ncbi:AMP-dependent synthetase/ligase [Saccharopolyspora rectivirgula]|uniref:Acyl-CoA synthetase n=1 Tax=Saccharopolyspora rectivirgula TaxID=28042 RepID=A0A073B2F8_9PSEU|nr:AMP-dependent synthetase/ligase [Saccharopolyspora rectivirgula]KEI45800.1 AMP-dependent synthetase [Saccharopolyspora rectivirgula]
MTTAEKVRAAVDGLTIPQLLQRNAQEHPDKPALTSGIGPTATTLSWQQLRNEVAALTQGLRSVGLDKGDRMLIMMSKRPEHWIVDLAATHLGALPCTVYDTLSTSQIRHIAEHSNATVVVLEGIEQFKRWAPVIDELTSVRAFVVLDESIIPPGDIRFVSYSELRGGGEHPTFASTFDRLTAEAKSSDPVTVVYTSGTTGTPKGVVLSHRNVIYESLMQNYLIPVPEHPRSVAYLPLAHIAERVLGIYMPICNAGHVTICSDPAQLLPTLQAVRPHGFFGVPRVWEKIAAGVQAQLETIPSEKAEVLGRARDLALEVFRLRAAGRPVPDEIAEEFAQLDQTVLLPIRASLGLDRSVRNFSGAAPIPTGVLEVLASIGLPVYEVWGLSETTGAATVSIPDCFNIGAVGRPAPGMEVKTAEDGELLVRGPVVFSGYLQQDGTVKPATDEQGWFPTGDMGTVDSRGLVTVTDRKKEIIITAGGKNIAPTRIESLLRAHPLIGQAAAIGDGRRYITALLVLDEETTPAWAEAHGIPVTDISELATHPQVRAELDAAVARANSELARVEQIKRYHVVRGVWTPESGELTPKLSLRRKVILERYREEIDQLYAE